MVIFSSIFWNLPRGITVEAGGVDLDKLGALLGACEKEARWDRHVLVQRGRNLEIVPQCL